LRDIDISRPGFESEVSEFLRGLFLSRGGFKDRVFEGRKLDFLGLVEKADDFVELVHNCL
jgi:hypothetical protein